MLWETRIFPLVETAWDAPDTATVATIALQILELIGLPHNDAAEHHGAAGAGLLGGVDAPSRGERQPDDVPVPERLMPSDGPPGDAGDDPDIMPTTARSRVGQMSIRAPDSCWMQPYDELEAKRHGHGPAAGARTARRRARHRAGGEQPARSFRRTRLCALEGHDAGCATGG